MKVKVIILRGETGLLMPGRLVDLPEQTAKDWIKKGYAVDIKEDKTVIETKELKRKHKTK